MMTRQTKGGFTLVEMVIVIVITGIIGGMVAVFLRAPVQQYMDVARRADMTDVADTALRRMARDLRLALPNSVRVTGACSGSTACFIEFLPTKGGGRYLRDVPGNSLNFLDFTTSDNSFEVIGPVPAFAAGDRVVVYNLGIAGANAYAGDNSSAWVSTAGAVVTINAFMFPFESPAARFHVISTPITYVCSPTPTGVNGTLTRYWGYSINPTQPSSVPIAGATGSARLATNVSSCRFTYDTVVVAQRFGVVTMNLGITEQGETATLYSAVHVSNQP